MTVDGSTTKWCVWPSACPAEHVWAHRSPLKYRGSEGWSRETGPNSPVSATSPLPHHGFHLNSITVQRKKIKMVLHIRSKQNAGQYKTDALPWEKMHRFYNHTDRREEEKQPSISSKGGVFSYLMLPLKFVLIEANTSCPHSIQPVRQMSSDSTFIFITSAGRKTSNNKNNSKQSLERSGLKIERLVCLSVTNRHVFLFSAYWKMEKKKKQRSPQSPTFTVTKKTQLSSTCREFFIHYYIIF